MGYVQSPLGLAARESLESTNTLILFFETEEM